MQILSRLIWAVALALSSASAVVAQDLAATDRAGPTVSREDSLEILRAARSDQAAFERLRRSRLPSTWYSGGGDCDERIGRFCLTHGAGRGTWQAPPEDERVVQARWFLIDGLGGAAAFVPGDGWIAGQRVRYLVEARRFADAVDAARECRAESWWCAALEGYALHYAALPLEADAAFDRALAAIGEDELARWTDLTLILDERSMRTYRRMTSEDRQEFADRFWRLADPLLTRPGNELRSEHLSRHVWDALQDRARSPDGLSWGYDLRELLIRYGWPSGWEQVRQSNLSLASASLISHYSNAPQYMLPPSSTLLDETGTAGEWDVEEPRPRTSYNIPIADSVARWITPVPHQIAVFRRADSALVVAAYDFPNDSLVTENPPMQAGFALISTTEPLGEPVIAVEPAATLSGSLAVLSPARPMLMSLEVLVPEEKWIARARYGLDIAPVGAELLAISDLLLLREPDELPDSLPDAIPLARGSTTVSPGERIGVFWEVYGVSPETTPEIALSLSLVEARPGLLRRLAQRVGLGREIAPIRVRWQEPISAAGRIARSLAVQIPDVEPGTYALELSVEAPGREALTVRRTIVVSGSRL